MNILIYCQAKVGGIISRKYFRSFIKQNNIFVLAQLIEMNGSGCLSSEHTQL